nr:Arm DNA-binding domain-containing protein [uncultured Agathobacter sp.]
MAVIKNKKTGMWEVRTYYKDWTGERKQKTKGALRRKAKSSNGNETSN